MTCEFGFDATGVGGWCVTHQRWQCNEGKKLMKSLKERLLDTAKGLENENYHTEAALMREAAGAVPPPPEVDSRGRVRRQFDPLLTGVLAHLIRDNNLHMTNREDTIGVLLRCGAFHAEPVESNRDGFIADLSTAIDAYHIRFQTHDHGCAKKLTFGELEVGDHFIGWPIPGDNSGHGGFLGSQRLFVKTQMKVERMHDSGEAKNGTGTVSTIPSSMTVIKVSLG